MPLRVAWLGEWSHPEFIALQSDDRRMDIPVRSESYPCVSKLVQALDRGEFPDLLLIAQPSSDELTEEAIESLIRLSPLMRWICCYGAWCDSDGRNRDLWPGGARVPTWIFRQRLHQELQALGQGGIVLLPWTASRDEIFQHDHPVAPGTLNVKLAVESPDAEYTAFLSSAGRMLGAELDSSHPDVILFDVDPDSDLRTERLEHCRREFPQASLIGLQGFPNSTQAERGKEQGLSQVVSKLTPLAELARILATLQQTA